MIRSVVLTLADTAGFAVRHPVRSALRVIGVAKGVVGAATGRVPVEVPVKVPVEVPEVPAGVPANPPLAVVPGQREPLPAAEQLPPNAPDEPSATERRAVEADPWAEPESDEPLLDPSLTKQVKGDLDRGLRDASPE